MSNCTITRNSAATGGGFVVFRNNLQISIANTILWANTASKGPQIGLITDNYALAHLELRHCDVQGGPEAVYLEQGCTLGWSSGNINADPLFVDADGPDNVFGNKDDELSLQPTSPCVDAGNNTAVVADSLDLDGDGDTSEYTPRDIEGHPRFVDDRSVTDTGDGQSPIIDMGAYERFDCNGNTISDDQDIADRTSADINANGIRSGLQRQHHSGRT
jgi:hypothetical protein